MGESAKSLSSADIVRLLGQVDDHIVAEIIDCKATLDEVALAAAYLDGEADALGDAPPPLSGRARIIHDMVLRAEETPDE